ncbi:hypothetical protein BJ546DRAFT_1064010 [Cryomyces antarcticus]
MTTRAARPLRAHPPSKIRRRVRHRQVPKQVKKTAVEIKGQEVAALKRREENERKHSNQKGLLKRRSEREKMVLAVRRSSNSSRASENTTNRATRPLRAHPPVGERGSAMCRQGPSQAAQREGEDGARDGAVAGHLTENTTNRAARPLRAHPPRRRARQRHVPTQVKKKAGEIKGQAGKRPIGESVRAQAREREEKPA